MLQIKIIQIVLKQRVIFEEILKNLEPLPIPKIQKI